MADPDVTISEENALERHRQLTRYRTVRDAFLAIFGPPGKRTIHGAVVLEELERYCGTRKTINETDSSNQTDIYRTARKHGRCDVMQAIHDAIEWREADHVSNSSGGSSGGSR